MYIGLEVYLGDLGSLYFSDLWEFDLGWLPPFLASLFYN